jgi:hypothetical protein
LADDDEAGFPLVMFADLCLIGGLGLLGCLAFCDAKNEVDLEGCLKICSMFPLGPPRGLLDGKSSFSSGFFFGAAATYLSRASLSMATGGGAAGVKAISWT